MKEHQLIDIEEILVNPENPRHTQIMMPDEVFIMQQLLRNPREATAMHKLISDIYTNGWYAQSIVTVTYDDKKGKFVAWDGNRRLTAMKILKNPKLIESLKYFSYTQIRSIYAMSANIQGEDFFEIPCYVALSFEECANYIRNIHTSDTGALKWDTASIKRFENKLGIKNIFAQLQGFCPKAFSAIDNEFSVSKFERIVSSKVGKEYLDIDFSSNVLMPLSSMDELDKKVSKIVQDISEGKVTTEVIKNNENIKKYLYQQENHDKVIKEDSTNKEDFKQLDLLKTNKKRNVRLIKKDETILFRNINCKNLNYSNERAKGIKRICYEIQYLSIGGLYKKCPIAYCFLIRSLLEQSCIYFLINKGKWEKWKSENNNIDLRLEKIISRISKDKQNLIFDDTISRVWEICFNNEGTKNYLDLVIHHPYKVVANTEAIKAITDMGLFAIIQFLIS